MKKKSVSLSVGRGEKSKSGGLTAKGRTKYNNATGSNLKPPVSKEQAAKSPKAAARRKSFCARSASWTGERGKAARKRWSCN